MLWGSAIDSTQNSPQCGRLLHRISDVGFKCGIELKRSLFFWILLWLPGGEEGIVFLAGERFGVGFWPIFNCFYIHKEKYVDFSYCAVVQYEAQRG